MTELLSTFLQENVSIRAPVKGRYPMPTATPNTRKSFNPRPREGAIKIASGLNPRWTVSIRAPVKGRSKHKFITGIHKALQSAPP